MVSDLLRGPQRTYYAESEIKDLWEYLDEAFDHYQCFNKTLSLKENISALLGSHMNDAVETELQRQTNTNSWFYGKESFTLGDLRIDTKY